MAADSSTLTKIYLEELLRPTLNAEGAQIEEISIKSLTKPGENYNSTMLAVDVILKPDRRLFHIVAKMLPKSRKMLGPRHFNVTVRKEIALYILVRPAFERIQKEMSVPRDKYLDAFPVCYGTRISSKGDSAPVDEGSVILMENLKVRGFECGDRFTGLDLIHCKLVVEKLARFHATTVAMKIKKPEEFKATVLQAAVSLVHGGPGKEFLEPLEGLPEYEKMKEKINTALLKGREIFCTKNPEPPREPFATMTHQDLWTMNIMFQYESGSSERNPTDLKLVDFEKTMYESPATDLLFFLYTSANLEVLSKHYDYLVKLYYNNFVDCLKVLGCNTTPFSYEEFLGEIEHSSTVEFWHIAFRLIPISIPEEDSLLPDDANDEDKNKFPKVGNTYAPRVSKLILDFAARNWI